MSTPKYGKKCYSSKKRSTENDSTPRDASKGVGRGREKAHAFFPNAA